MMSGEAPPTKPAQGGNGNKPCNGTGASAKHGGVAALPAFHEEPAEHAG